MRWQSSQPGRALLGVLLFASLVLAGCTSPQESAPTVPTSAPPVDDEALAPEGVKGGSGQGGGRVKNVAPDVRAFTGNLAEADNSGSGVETFSFTLFDATGEKDFSGATVTVTVTGPDGAVPADRVVTHRESRGASTEPATFTNGWKVWSGAANDGQLLVQFRYTYPLGITPGSYTSDAKVALTDSTTAQSGTDATTVIVFSEITVGPVVDANGQATGTAWGEWQAVPGATNVASANYVRVHNTGQLPDASVVLDFTGDAFTGATDANFTVPITNNVQFAWCEVAGPAGKPSDCTFNFLSANADGTVTVTFTGLDKVVFVQYRIVQMPSVLASQTYGAAFTATEL